MTKKITYTLDEVFAADEKNEEFKRLLRARRMGSSFRAAVINRRSELGLTQADLAKLMGTKQAAVSRFEAGKTLLREDTIVKIAEALQAEAVLTLVPLKSEEEFEPHYSLHHGFLKIALSTLAGPHGSFEPNTSLFSDPLTTAYSTDNVSLEVENNV